MRARLGQAAQPQLDETEVVQRPPGARVERRRACERPPCLGGLAERVEQRAERVLRRSGRRIEVDRARCRSDPEPGEPPVPPDPRQHLVRLGEPRLLQQRAVRVGVGRVENPEPEILVRDAQMVLGRRRRRVEHASAAASCGSADSALAPALSFMTGLADRCRIIFMCS